MQKQDETQTVVKSGVTPPERVVTTGFARLTDGARRQARRRGGAGGHAAGTRARLAPAQRDPAATARRRMNRDNGAGAESRRRNERLLAVHPPARSRPRCSASRSCWAALLGYLWLPVSALPQVDFPTIQVTTQLPGANPDTIASLVTAPLERQFGQIPALQMMTSSSSFGISQVTLQFALNRDIDAAAQDVQSAINAAGSALPRNLPYPPLYSKVNPADVPMITLALTSKSIDLRSLSDMADTIMAPRLSEVSGVGHVSVQGGIRPAIRIQANLSRLAAYGIGLEDLRTAIVGANVAGPKGALDGAHQAYTIAANDQIESADAYKSVVVAYRNGAPVLLSDVADVKDGLENDKVGAWYQGKPAVVIDVQRQPGANVIETVERVRAELPRLQARHAGRRRPHRRQRPHQHHPRLDPRRAVHAGA